VYNKCPGRWAFIRKVLRYKSLDIIIIIMKILQKAHNKKRKIDNKNTQGQKP